MSNPCRTDLSVKIIVLVKDIHIVRFIVIPLFYICMGLFYNVNSRFDQHE